MTTRNFEALPDPLSEESFYKLFLSAFPSQGKPFVWTHADAEIVCLPGKTRLKLSPGMILVSLTVATDQTGETQINIPLAVGTSPKDAALLATTEQQMRGHQVIAGRWSSVVQDAVWQMIIDVGQTIIQRQFPGQDYIPGGLFVNRAGLTFVPVPRASLAEALKGLS